MSKYFSTYTGLSVVREILVVKLRSYLSKGNDEHQVLWIIVIYQLLWYSNDTWVNK